MQNLSCIVTVALFHTGIHPLLNYVDITLLQPQKDIHPLKICRNVPDQLGQAYLNKWETQLACIRLHLHYLIPILSSVVRKTVPALLSSRRTVCRSVLSVGCASLNNVICTDAEWWRHVCSYGSTSWTGSSSGSLLLGTTQDWWWWLWASCVFKPGVIAVMAWVGYLGHDDFLHLVTETEWVTEIRSRWAGAVNCSRFGVTNWYRMVGCSTHCTHRVQRWAEVYVIEHKAKLL